MESDGFKQLEVTQKELQLCLRSSEGFDPQGALDNLCSGVQSLQDTLKAAHAEKKQLESTVEHLRCLLKANAAVPPEQQQRAEKVERLRRGMMQTDSSSSAAEGTTGEGASHNGGESPPDSGGGSAAAAAPEAEAQESGVQAVQGTTNDRPDLQELCTSMASFSKAVTSLRCQPQEADAVRVAKAVRKEAEPLVDRGDDKDLDCLRRDLNPEKPLQSLTDLMSHLDPLKEDDGEMGKVIKGLAADVQGLIEEFQGHTPVDFSKEDAMMQSHIQKYIYDVIKSLKQEEKGAEMLSTNLEFEGEKLCEKIKELSEKLSAKVVQKRGFVERQRMEKMQHLITFYARRVMTVTSSQNKPAEKLQDKRKELLESSLQDIEDYKRMQNYQQERAAELSDQQLRLKDFVANKEKAYKQEVRLFNTVQISLRLLQRHHAATVTNSLEALWATALAWSQARVRLEEAHIASVEAVKLEEMAAPRLKDAELTHWQARGRLVRAEGLLARFGRCLDGAYVGLLEKAEHDRQECARKAPEYGVRYVQVRQKLFCDAASQMALLQNLRQKNLDKGCTLEEEVEQLEYTSSEDDIQLFEQKKKELEAVHKQLEEFDKDISWLEALQESETDDRAVAEQAAQEADPSVQDKVERWLKDFYFGGAGRKLACTLATPRSTPRRLQLEQDADDDTTTVRSCSDFCIIENDTLRRVAEDVQAH